MESPEVVITNKHRIKELTYKLIYPAFFGNMVYDVVALFKDISWTTSPLVAATGFILVFFMADYVHLYVDLENIVPEEMKNKWWYMAADIGVSFALFLAVAFVKFELPEVSVVLVCIVPVLFAWYNIELGYHPKFHRNYRKAAIGLCVGFVLIATAVYFFSNSNYKLAVNSYLLLVCVLLTGAYLFYNRKYFWKPDKPNLNE